MPDGRTRTTTTRRTGELVSLRPPQPAQEPDERLSDVDEWGRSERVRTFARRMFGPVYHKWFRVEWDGLEKVPRSGGALLVANHAGAVPADAPVIMHGLEEELSRPVYGLADYFFRSVPVLGTAWARSGGVPAHADNAYRLLRHDGQLVLTFPEGTKATGKLYSERYQLRRFGRGGFVEIAMRAGVPVVPITVVGAEEAMPNLVNLGHLARVLGVPYVPVTANMLLFGPLGVIAHFPTKFKLRVLDPVRFEVAPEMDRYPRSLVFEQAEKIRQQMQESLYDMLRRRRSIWFG